ncbi:endonuclease/exonuclease/phosphatase family protein [bacterium]
MKRILLKVLLILFSLGIAGYLFLWLWAALIIKPLDKIPHKPQGALRVLMSNVNYRNTQKTILTRHFINLQVDVGIILEWTGASLDTNQLTQTGYKIPVNYRVPSPCPHGIAAFARASLNPKAQVIRSQKPDVCRMPMATLNIQWQDTSINIIGLHTPPPLLKCYKETPKRLDEISTLVANGQLTRLVGICQPDQPLIIAGDLNMFPFHPSVKRFKKQGLIEVYDTLHILSPVSWSPFPWVPPFVRLDYLYCTETFKVIHANYVHIPGSDHKGIIADLIIESQNGVDASGL